MLQSSENEWFRDKGLNVDTSQKYSIDQKQPKELQDVTYILDVNTYRKPKVGQLKASFGL